jgi:amidase
MRYIIIILSVLVFSCQTQTVTEDNTIPDYSFALEETTISQLHEQYENGTYTIVDVVSIYLDRIEEIDRNGPKLNSIITVNPDALQIAEELEAERKEGKIRGPLHGIPVIIKDNIDTHDKMPNTAGSIILKDSYPDQDAYMVKKLRDAGAVIIAKANLSEWANFHSTFSSSGWSPLGGQTKNPYDLTRNPCGSSAGTGASISANLAVVGIGTETNGSITCPSNNNGLVGIKPTVGLISRSGIIPISFTQDTPGPMTRTVADAVVTLGALTGVDEADTKTLASEGKALTDYTSYLKEDGLNGKKIGYWTGPMGNHHKVDTLYMQMVRFIESQGAELVEIETISENNIGRPQYQVLLYEYKDGLNNYFESLGGDAPVKNIDELAEAIFSNADEMRYFNHETFNRAMAKGDLDSEEYLEALENARKGSQEEGIDRVMDEHGLDAIIAPTGGPAWKTDLVNGDNFGISSSSPAAISGYPNITVPMGNIDGLPVGMSFFGRAWSEPVLIECAYSFEQATKARIIPQFLNSSHP